MQTDVDDISSAGHNLPNKLLTTTAPVRAKMMHHQSNNIQLWTNGDDDDDDFFDALDHYQASTYSKSTNKGPAQNKIVDLDGQVVEEHKEEQKEEE